MKLFSKGLWARIMSMLLVCSMVSVSFGSAANARFISPDDWDPTMPGVGTNRYAYAQNDPINKSDPNGHVAVVDDIVGLGLATLAVAAFSYTYSDALDDGRLNGSAGRGLGAAIHDSFNALASGIFGHAKVEGIPTDEPTKAPPNPNGAKGKPDHQQKVKELAEQAQKEALPGQSVVTEGKISAGESNRRPDVQIQDETGVTISVKEAERNPNGKRNKEREAEYDRLGIKNETYGVGKGEGKGKSDGSGGDGKSQPESSMKR
ncbi:hypothetical protein GCM10010924_61940 [Rhizobium wenxiniae]|nr:hypothetical protein GCM10010924_61940 [Rhizobium wenxiniae]